MSIRTGSSLLALALVAAALSCATSRSSARDTGPAAGAGPGVRAEINAMMVESARAWNRGDLDTFVGHYLDSQRTSFVGRRGVLHGRAAIGAAYAPRFAAPGMQDSLSFEDVAIDSLAPGVAHVLAFYVLSRGDSTVARGPTSLVMERVGGRWEIVHDHSS